MENDMRKDIDRVKNFSKFINENKISNVGYLKVEILDDTLNNGRNALVKIKGMSEEMREQIDNFRNFMSRGEIRKKAEELLGQLSAAYLGNIAWDNREEIQKRLDNINNSGIDWDKDVVKSVRDNYRQLTSSEVINNHMNRKGDGFSK